MLDVGCADGALFRQLGDRLGEGVGIDPDVRGNVVLRNAKLISGSFPESLEDQGSFDVITMTAVLARPSRTDRDRGPGLP